MHDFHLAPLRTYKVLLAVAALAAPIVYFLCVLPPSYENGPQRLFALRVARMSLPWLAGWFLVLFGDGSFGRTIVTPLRSYYVILGVGLIILPMVWAGTWAQATR
jgi:hypothetical protein